MNTLLTSLLLLFSLVQMGDPTNLQRGTCKADTIFSAVEGEEGQYWNEDISNWDLTTFVAAHKMFSLDPDAGTSSAHVCSLPNPFGIEAPPICHERPLISAIMHHDLKAVKKAIDEKEAFDAVDEKGKTALHYAAEYDNAEATQLLMEAGSDLKRKDLFGSTPLRIAIYHNSLKTLRVLIKEVEKSDLDELLRDVALIEKRGQAAQLLIEAGADVNRADKHGYTALHKAAEEDKVEVARVLIGRGADINKVTKYRWTPLFLASAWKNSRKVAKLLIQQGADLSKADRYGCTALFKAVQYCNLEIVKMLIKAGADWKRVDSNGWTVLHVAVDSRCYEAAKLLLKVAPGLKERSTSWWGFLGFGQKPIDIAKEKGDQKMVALLEWWLEGECKEKSLDADMAMPEVKIVHRSDADGFNPYVEEEKGYFFGEHFSIWDVSCLADPSGMFSLPNAPLVCPRNLFSLAIIENNLEVFKGLEKRGGLDPALLHCAAKHHNTEAARRLIAAGVDLKQRAGFLATYTPLSIAALCNSLEVLQLLAKEADADDLNEALWDVAVRLVGIKKQNRGEAARLLIDAGADIHQEHDGPGWNWRSWTPLHAAAKCGHPEIVELLIEKEANISKGDRYGYTALHEAAMYGRIEIVKKFIRAGGNPRQAAHDGWTLLHIAVARGHVDIVTFLIQEGAKVNKADQRGYTALHKAVGYGRMTILKMLIAAGADLGQAAKNGWTTLHIAVRYRQYEMAGLLLKFKPDLKDKATTWCGFPGLGQKPIDMAQERGDQGMIELLSAS